MTWQEVIVTVAGILVWPLIILALALLIKWID